jgi:hypothetical protein
LTGYCWRKWAALLAIVFASGGVYATDYYCDPVNGSPANSGTAASPWRRLDEVFSAGKTFISGDNIYLRNGNHGDPVVSGGLASGSRAIRAQPGQTPKLRTLRFQSGATRWVVDGVLVSPQEANGSLINTPLVQFDTGATNNTFQNSNVRYAPDGVATNWENGDWVNNSGTAIYVIGANNQVINNMIRNSRNGVMLERTSTAGAGATNSSVVGNNVVHFWEDAYRCKVNNCTLEYNSAVNSYAVVPPGTESDPPHRDMFQSYRGDGSFTPINNVVLRGNVFISRQGTRYTKVPFQYNGHYTIQGISAFDGPYSNWTIENNVVMVEVGLALAVYGMDNSKIVNNTVVPNPLATDSEIRIFNEKGGSPSDNNILRNNLAHQFNISAATNLQQSNNITVGTSYTTYFANYAAGDVRLKSGSAAINAGTTTDAPNVDANNYLRGAPYDVGAYEFGATSVLSGSSGDGFHAFAIRPPATGTFTASFDAKPSLWPENAVVGLSSGAAADFPDMSCIARFNPNGMIDAYDGTGYAAAATIQYAPGVSYHFRFVVNLPARTYSVYVTPAGGSELTLGVNYAFRSTAYNVTSLDNWNLQVGATLPNASLTVTNLNP